MTDSRYDLPHAHKRAREWLDKYYPTPANEVDVKDAAAHSLHKWRGCMPDVLKEYGLKIQAHAVLNDKAVIIDNAYNTRVLSLGESTCALCHVHIQRTNCKKCPLYIVTGNVTCGSDESIYNIAVDTDNIPLLVHALEAAVAYESDGFPLEVEEIKHGR